MPAPDYNAASDIVMGARGSRSYICKCSRGHMWESTDFDSDTVQITISGIAGKQLCVRCVAELLDRECGTLEKVTRE